MSRNKSTGYWIVVSREHKTADWVLEFGDHDKATCEFEREDLQYNSRLQGETTKFKIVRCTSARNNDVLNKVFELNQ